MRKNLRYNYFASKNRYDVVIIGSGPAGLTAGTFLAKHRLSVGIFEQHPTAAGGGLHSFFLKGHGPYSPAFHYVGLDGILQSVYQELGLSRHLKFRRLNPNGFDRIVIGDQEISQPQGLERWLKRLCERFPWEREGLTRYFKTICDIVEHLKKCGGSFSFPEILTVAHRLPVLAYWSTKTLADLLNDCIRDPLLRAILAAQCGNHGLPPSQVSLLIHAAMTVHYLKGAYYPCGGATSIAEAYIEELHHDGGDIRLNARVKRILVEHGRAVGIQLENGEIIRATYVICNADPAILYGQLLPAEYCPKERRQAQHMEYSISAISLFCAVTDLPSSVTSGNIWWYRTSNMEAIYRQMMGGLPSERVDFLFIGSPSLKDPGHKRKRGQYTLEMFTLVPYAPFVPWADLPVGKRGADYEEFKNRLRDLMIAAAGEAIPGFKDKLTFCDVGTPLTCAAWLGSHNGALYGKASLRSQLSPFSYRRRGPVEGLILCGASVRTAHGFAGATMDGVAAAADLLGVKPAALFTDPGPPLEICPAEPQEIWFP